MPELKSVRAPAAVADLYKDLRDRRLLPVVALVVVAIAAVPFLLGDDVEQPAPTPSTAAGVDGGRVESAGLTVVESQPGLRDYRKRLDGRSPSNPFKQQYTGVPPGAQLTESSDVGGLGGGEGTSGEGTGGEGGVPPGGTGTPPPGTSPDGGGGDNPDLIEVVFDVQVSRSQPGAEEDEVPGKPKTHRRVRTFAPLPGKKAPVVTTMGINLRTLKVLFLVSDQTHSLAGEFRCMARTPNGICELVEVEPGFLFEVVYGPNKVRYSFKVIDIDAIRAGKIGADRYERAGLAEGLEGVLSGR